MFGLVYVHCINGIASVITMIVFSRDILPTLVSRLALIFMSLFLFRAVQSYIVSR